MIQFISVCICSYTGKVL